MKVYHGSPNKFDAFDYSLIGTQGTAEGRGFYFTDSLRIALGYARQKDQRSGYLYTAEWNPNKSLSEKEVTISRSDLSKLLLALDAETEYLSNWGDINYFGIQNVLELALIGEFDEADNDVDIINSIASSSGDAELTLKLTHDLLGYDSIISTPKWGGEQTLYIALVNEAFKIIDIQEITQI